MSRCEEPLPLEGTRRLVVAGPYGYVRNPMAVTGLGHGLSVAVVLHSLEVAVYVVVGLLVWSLFVRPEEERYLESEFGTEFILYRGSIGCWWPRRRRYTSPSADRAPRTRQT